MINKLFILSILLILLIFSSQTFAQSKEDKLAAALLKYPQADTNKDGTLTMQEAKAFRKKYLKKSNKSKRNKKINNEKKLPKPTHANLVYGSHPRNVLDLWLAPSDKPTPLLVNIHGGGFKGGDKSKISAAMIKMMHKQGISVASINYRFKEAGQSRFEGESPLYPSILHDGARALQFLRYKASKYNLDKAKFAATGGSAGGQMLMWLGFHSDLAQADHDDPVLRESSRLQALAPRGGQTTSHYPTMLKWFGVKSLNFGKKEGVIIPSSEARKYTDKELALMSDASPINHWTKDDPPIYLYYPGANVAVDETTLFGTWVHHPLFGIKLKEAMYYKGMEAYLEYKDGPPVSRYKSQYDFIIQTLKSLPTSVIKADEQLASVSTDSDSALATEDTINWNTTGLQQANSMGGGAAEISKSGKFRVFVLMGQSNMQGAGRAKELKAPYNQKHDRIRIWANGSWQYFVPSNRHGPGVSFVHQLADYWPDDTIGIIKVASGGTGIRGFEKNWSFERANLTFDGKKGSLYKDLMNAVAEAKRISNPEFSGFFWKQGAADGTKKILAKEYYDTFKQLISDLRTDLDAPELPVFLDNYLTDEDFLKTLLSKMSDEDVIEAKKAAGKPPKNDQDLLKLLVSYVGEHSKILGKRRHIGNVILAKNRVARDIPNVTTLYFPEMPRLKDNVHYNSEGYVMMGKITATAVQKYYQEMD